ncbi:BTB/POZ domain-containing protein [Aspergillus mulundensis]|uniref:BTB domain-containing protein n=1 Tax=Aspergillus mulundensis TaxID=1810919 RepID=A0A3D8RAK7_9EURO|nr:hypothetical protein DSM5745_08432 [Aspergillus mulundensis]RDW70921.1 hypothetical protein DSM5745_08432 [Aspergillus mulundensis]
MQPDYVLDPRGKVILVVHKPNAPFAAWFPPVLCSTSSDPATSDPTRTNHENSTERDVGNNDSWGNGSTNDEESPALESETEKDAEGDGNTQTTEVQTQQSEKDADEAAPDVQIQVSERHLTLVSPVFEKMLWGDFKEAKEYKEKGSVVIDVGSWDVDALLIVLNILHCQRLGIPKKVTVEQMAQIAVIADYYSCDFVRFFGSLWAPCLPKKPCTSDPRELMLGLWIAYFFRHSLTFTNYSRAIMEYSESIISSLGLPLPVTVIDAMNDKRIEAISRAVSEMYEQRDCLLSDTIPITQNCDSECRSVLLGAFMRHMYKHQFHVQAPEAPYVGIQLARAREVRNFQARLWMRRCEREEESSSDLFEYHDCNEDNAFRARFEASSPSGLDLAEYTN